MVPIAFILRRSTIVFNSLQDSAITWPRDFIGKKVRTVFTVDQTPRVTMAKGSISLDQYERVFLPSDIAQFASGDVPVGGRFIISLTNIGEDQYGWMNHDTWNAMAQTFRLQGDLEQSLNVEDVYTMQFLEELYGK